MKDIRKYIDDNRELFDDKEPSAGHIARFEALLDKQKKESKPEKPTGKKIFISIISVAASLAILIGIAIKYYNPESAGPHVPVENCLPVDEFQAANEYYNEQMEAQIADIMCKLANTDTQNQTLLSEDIQRIVTENTQFVSEMAESENKEIAIYYLVKHYRANIEALQNINEKLGKYTNC